MNENRYNLTARQLGDVESYSELIGAIAELAALKKEQGSLSHAKLLQLFKAETAVNKMEHRIIKEGWSYSFLSQYHYHRTGAYPVWEVEA
jgi:hypothetical protein